MKIAIFGATGGTGKEATRQALEQGHIVQALVRTPSKLTITSEQLTLIQGDVQNAEVVSQTIEGTDAVIISLGNTANNPDMIVSKGTAVILQAMKAHNVQRVIVVTSLGTGHSKEQVPFAFKMLMKTILRKAFIDKNKQEELVKESALDWVIVRPGGLTNGDRTGGKYQVSTGSEIVAGQIARADVAEFVLKQLTSDTYLHKTPAIT